MTTKLFPAFKTQPLHCFNKVASLTFDDMVAALDQSGMAKQKYPERLEIIDAFPRTPAGKIRKNVLRERIVEAIAAEQKSAAC